MDLIPRSFFFDEDFDKLFLTSPRRNEMKCDIYEVEGKYHIEIDLPGYDKKDISIETKDGYLTIKASKMKEEEDKDKNYLRRERSYGEYQRSFALGDADTEKIEAKFDKGTLLVTVPKIDENENKKFIEIQ